MARRSLTARQQPKVPAWQTHSESSRARTRLKVPQMLMEQRKPKERRWSPV
jgi:hypothetical protein